MLSHFQFVPIICISNLLHKLLAKSHRYTFNLLSFGALNFYSILGPGTQVELKLAELSTSVWITRVIIIDWLAFAIALCHILPQTCSQ